ncbi:MAG: hypothetical protein ACREO2_07870, partial [Arenimonas sp.]
MFNDAYNRMLENARYKPYGKKYRDEVVQNLVTHYVKPEVNIVQRQKVLRDAWNLLDLPKLPENESVFMKLNIKELTERISENNEPSSQNLGNLIIENFSDLEEQSFLNYAEFENYWKNLKFQNIDEFLDNFYWFAPYVVIDIDQKGLGRV